MKKLIYLLLIVFFFSCEKERCIPCTITKQSEQAYMQYTIYLCGDDIRYTDGILVKPVIINAGWNKITINCK